MLPEAQARLGVAMLDTRFPRLHGDVGNPATFPMPVDYAVVRGAAPRRVVASAEALRASGLLPAFVDAFRRLEAQGATMLSTSCGFLVLLQQDLQAAVRVPVVTSSLLMLPRLIAQEARVGVLTIDARSLSEQFLLAAGVHRERLDDVIVEGVDPQGEFAGCILGNRDAMDAERARDDVVAAACSLVRRAPEVRTIVLECTNMPPHARDVMQATGRRVVGLPDAIASLHL